MVEMLTPIWERVLQRSSIDVEDNFFDLGGDSALALQLFQRNRARLRSRTSTRDHLLRPHDCGSGRGVGTTC